MKGRLCGRVDERRRDEGKAVVERMREECFYKHLILYRWPTATMDFNSIFYSTKARVIR